MSDQAQKPDPTENVMDLVEAGSKRQDDLRAAFKELVQAKIDHVNDKIDMQARHEAELRSAEAERINAIRDVDVGAVAIERDRTHQSAITLATHVANTAETLRGLVATTATAHATQLSQITTQITDRLALLEKSQYEKSGGSMGMKDLTGWIIGGVALLLTFVGIVATVITVVVLLRGN